MRNKFFKRLHRRILVGCVAFLFVVLAASLSWASTITYLLEGTSFPSTISATIEMTYDQSSTTLHFEITNTSSAVSSSLTAFAFNVPVPPEYDVTGILSFATPNVGWFGLSDFDTISGAGDINTPGQFGFFDMAGVTNEPPPSNFQGGSVAAGIPQTETFEFDFVLTGNNIDSLITSDFNLLSDPGSGDSNPQIIVARFQGIDFGGTEDDFSDVATVIPIPSAILLLGSGILGLAGLRKKFIGRG